MDLQTILSHNKDAVIAVIGDICLDTYYFIHNDNTEVSVETGLKTNAVSAFKHELGGAGNVAVNCRRLGAGRVDIYGIIGSDYFGMIVRELLLKEQIRTEGMFVQEEGWLTHVYHKVYDKDNELPRYDIGNYNSPDESTIDSLILELKRNIHAYDIIIINEQVLQGLHNSYFQKCLTEVMRASGNRELWLTDSRKLQDVYTHTIHKLNNHEARELYASYHQLLGNHQPDVNQQDGKAEGNAADKEASAQKIRNIHDRDLLLWLYDHWREPVVITRGEDGAVSYDGETMHTVLGLHIIKSIDAVGAGDAFIAGLAMALAAGASLGEAAEVGNETAGVSVQTLYETGHPTIDEVLEIHKRGDYRYNPELARDKRLAELLPETDIEVIRSSLKGSSDHAYPAVVVFDHDGTISTLRQGWEGVMKRMMVMSIAGSAYNELSSALLEEIEAKADQVISKTTGVQTLIQMYELVDLIQESGFIPPSEILSPAEYKNIYNEMLMKNVHKKAERFQSGQLSLEDVTMKGAVEFLKTLRKKGVILYLASGTDQEDVRKEAEMLGYADCFNGGIYGSVGDVSRDPKQMVMKGILEKIEERPDAAAERCAVFGDGPVEIREARKHGMVAVGMLSDERQRFGRNEAKRERLVLAGADLLLPDFSCREEFSRWIGWKA